MRIKLLALFCIVTLIFSCEDDYKYGPGGILNDAIDTSFCDTMNVKYSTHIAPLLKDKCTPCHFSPSKSGNVSLDDYNSVVKAVNSQNLSRSVNYQSSPSKNMPPSRKMPKCSLQQISIWIQNGLPQ